MEMVIAPDVFNLLLKRQQFHLAESPSCFGSQYFPGHGLPAGSGKVLSAAGEQVPVFQLFLLPSPTAEGGKKNVKR